MFNLHLTAEQIEFRDTVRSFAMNEIRPVAIHPERLESFDKPLLRVLLDKASELGLRTLTLSEESGGVGADTMTSCIVFEELAAGDVDIAIMLGQTSLLGDLLFDSWMENDQKVSFLPQFIEDETFHLSCAGGIPEILNSWCYHGNLHEKPKAELTAVREGNEWIIDGSVSYVANAPIAELFIVMAETGSNGTGADGTIGLLVSRNTPGFTINASKNAVGESDINWRHGCGTGVEFNSCKVPLENQICKLENTLVIGEHYSRQISLQTAAINLGLGRASFDAAVEYTKIRRQGGRNIVEHQAIGKKIADMAIKLELASTIIWKAAWVADHPEVVADRSVSDLPQHTIASIFTAEAVHEVTLIAAECFGAMGVMRDMPVQKYVNDGFMFLHSDINDITTRLPIAEKVVNYRRSKAA